MKKILPVTWVAGIGMLVVIALSLKGESSRFFGIADDQEQTISFEFPVEIVRTLVVEGSDVKRGDLLMEVRNTSLHTDLAVVTDELQELRSQNKEDIETLKSKLLSFQAKKEALRADMNSQISVLKARYELNNSFINELYANNEISKSKASNKNSPLLDKIKGLRIQRQHLIEAVQAKIDNIKSQLYTSKRPIESRISSLENKKQKLLEQVSDFKIRSKFNGKVGSLLFKAGETVSPYLPILTVHGSKPNYVKAYINENVVNKVTLGQNIWVKSSTNQTGDDYITGKVEGLGSRIVEYPLRLKRNPMVAAWGREVVIRLQKSHSLLLGEKVIVLLKKPYSIMDAFANNADSITVPNDHDENHSHNNQHKSHKVANIPLANKDIVSYVSSDTSSLISVNKAIDAKKIEASGVLNDRDNDRYIVVGDESQGDTIELYDMNNQGVITERIKVDFRDKPFEKIDDIESISGNGQSIYIAASLSHNTSGKLKKKRKKFFRLTKNKNNLLFDTSVDLHQILITLSKTSVDTGLRHFLQQSISSKNMDIESHFFIEDALYLGFKSPLNIENKSVIVKIKNIFNKEDIDGEIWAEIDLNTDKNSNISDMVYINEKLLILSVSDRSNSKESYLTEYDVKNNRIKNIATFNDLKAEGISQSNSGENKYIIVFDEGGRSESRYLTLYVED